MKHLPLTPEILISAYCQGLFPMDVDGRIHWFNPDPRTILPLETFHIPRRLAQTIRQGRFEIRINTHFAEVMRGCADREEGTWISEEIISAYVQLHDLGLAHCLETWQDGELAGGIYGVSLGGAFFGESMFHYRTDASKVALVELVRRLRARGFSLLDVQFSNPHLAQFGTAEIPRSEYLARLRGALQSAVTFA